MDNIIETLKRSNNIVLLCHNNPDGDAVGSSLALYHALKSIGKNIDIVIEKLPQKFSFLKGSEAVKKIGDQKYALGIILDTANKPLVNNPCNILDTINTLIVIDHHQSNTKYGDINYVEPSSSCCELIYKLIDKMHIEVTEEIAKPIITGILTDTGGFANSNVSENTFKVAAKLSKIINISNIYRQVLHSISKAAFILKKIAFSHLELLENDQIAFSYITYKDIALSGAEDSDTDILVNIGREIDTVEVSIFTRVYEHQIRVSLRSNDIDVNEIASYFGGGGHKKASGLTTTMVFDILKKELLTKVKEKINEWNISNK